jgi:hypothetical protein
VEVRHEIASQIPGRFLFVIRRIGDPPADIAPAVTRLKSRYSNEKILTPAITSGYAKSVSIECSLWGHSRPVRATSMPSRRIATRNDKLAADYLAFVKLAFIRIWLEHCRF